MSRQIEFTNLYLKDLHLARKRNLPEEELNRIIERLANDIPLDVKHKDHSLRGNYRGYRECHIRPDWLLIYKKEDDKNLSLLYLMRTGAHSDLF
ncbi:MAG: type II toxin-antitoxin system YafQ family toxin [Dysgonamonadaceae bacterium]|jgi:mRNA interferase YafQ|nr:type II toxin-antitoxin system YafQ family toxin [Dysgonamonadaceae bacterium]